MDTKNLPKFVLFEVAVVGISGRSIRGIVRDAQALKVPIAVRTAVEKGALIDALKRFGYPHMTDSVIVAE